MDQEYEERMKEYEEQNKRFKKQMKWAVRLWWVLVAMAAASLVLNAVSFWHSR